MIWSNSEAKVVRFRQTLEAAHVLQHSRIIHPYLVQADLDLEPVSYFRIPFNNPTKLVTPYVTLSPDGRLTHPGQGVYGIQTRALKERYLTDDSKLLFEEANALAERTALSRGLFVPRGRASAEEAVLTAIPPHFRKPYAYERIEYLETLTHEAAEAGERQFGLGSRDVVLEGLALAINTLRPFTE